MSKYSDGEFQPSYEESIRGIRIYCLFHFSKSDNLMELLLMIDAAKRLQQDILLL
jgi:ribose-phosphate pyrophosphokinase